jgi:hypothetical protein
VIGTSLSHYRITEKLGHGGMGEVYRAEDTNLSWQVTIKVLPDEFAHDAERLAWFEREAKRLASLSHPNIAAIHGLEEHEGKRFLVLELFMKRAIAAALFVAFGFGLSGYAFGEGITIGNYTLVSERRIARGVWEMVCKAQAINRGFTAYGVTATVTSRSPHTSIVEGSLSFGDVYSLASVTSSDTFTIRQNRAHHLDPKALVWSVSSAGTITITITTNPANLAFTIDGQTYTSSQTLSLVTGSSHTVATTSPQGSGGTRYVFAGWSDGGAINHRIMVPAGPTAYSAAFTMRYQLSTSVFPASGGGVTSNPTSPDAFYDSGTSVQLAAISNTDYLFTGWGGALTGLSNPQSVTLTSPLSVVAYFGPAVSGGQTVSASVGATAGGASTSQTAVEDRVILLRSIRHSSMAEHTRVVVELDGHARYQEKQLSHPTRIYFDLSNTILGPEAAAKTIVVKDRFLRQIRSAQNRPGIVRVVLDLAPGTRCAVSELSDPFRIIVDIRK